MFPRFAPVLALALALQSACGPKPQPAPARPAPSPPGDAAFSAPPGVTGIRAQGAEAILTGLGAPGATVRLGTPGGAALFAIADPAGRWSLRLPPAREARIFGLSEAVEGRQVQAQGYVFVEPQGRAALLRAGAGALRLDSRAGSGLTAVDFDREGGTIVSGVASPGASLVLKVDGRRAAEGRADAAGRYAIHLNAALARGPHDLEVAGVGAAGAVRVQISPAAPLVSGPMRSQLTDGGLRIDWMTPGGGVQSTILLD